MENKEEEIKYIGEYYFSGKIYGNEGARKAIEFYKNALLREIEERAKEDKLF